ncbi:unnamed protein product [Amoebophrya sp. A25]|nr:unnamed protein product [Amoebophrya sp. A25]|eukprot:GSA25T00001575001.1
MMRGKQPSESKGWLLLLSCSIVVTLPSNTYNRWYVSPLAVLYYWRASQVDTYSYTRGGMT